LSHSRPMTGRAVARAFNDLLFQRACNTKDRINLSSGNPSFAPFAPAVTAMEKTARRSDNQIYASGAGYRRERDKLVPFCNDIGLRPDGYDLTPDNIVFGMGATHLYYTALIILQQKFCEEHRAVKPVILMSAPSYGLFTTQPESLGYDIETFPLRPENGWQVEPDIAENRIRAIEADGSRKVCALYNINPHNPTGTVTPAPVTEKLAKMLKSRNIWAIDDMAYYGLEYDAVPTPLATHHFDKTITLLSTSKAFGLPRVRAAFACGHADMMTAINDHIGMQMISLPSTVAPVLDACYGPEHRAAAQDYLEKNRTGYMVGRNLVHSFIYGLQGTALKDDEVSTLYKILREAFGNKKEADRILRDGTPELRLANVRMDSGYFAMLQIGGLDNYFYGTTRLKNTFQFAAAAVDMTSTLTLPLSCSVTNAHPDMLRATFGGMSPRRMVRGLQNLVDTLRALPTSPDVSQQNDLQSRGLALDHRFEMTG
jgi:aspartate/methionine/tyrosine aminotransferase